MSGYIDFAASNKCYAVTWSYGEICIGCNCCGRIEKGLKMWKARINYHELELNRSINFNEWNENFIDLQKKNVKTDIAYHKSKIKYYNKIINKIHNKI